jgi:FKBP-type peptidyl-prolyl cis-trans isomerase FklB
MFVPMKKIFVLALLVTGSVVSKAQHAHTPLTNELDSFSYALGMNIASSFKSAGITELNFDIFKEAVKHALVENHVDFDGNTANEIVNKYVAKIKAEEAARQSVAGTEFLAKNATKPGVITLPSGLQYKVITQGTGPKPVDGQKVTTHYRGTLIDGKVFDSSYDRGQPATFGVNQVIAGWTEALKLMPVGSKWELYIPYNLAYGERAMGANIPAYSALIFEIELLEIAQ